MTPADRPEPDDHRVAASLAAEAAERLVDIQQTAARAGSLGWGLEYEGDEVAHDLLMARLARERPDDEVLSEEGRDSAARLDSDRTWIVDPLDGSADFGVGAAEWAVHVALTERGHASAGAVAVPGLGAVFSTSLVFADEIAGEAERRRSERDFDEPIVVTGRSRAWSDGQAVAGALGGRLASCGSSGYKAMLVMTGHADVYVHAAGLMEWDVCAPAVVAAAHGLTVSDASGRPLTFNRPRPVVPGLIVSRPELHTDVLEALTDTR